MILKIFFFVDQKLFSDLKYHLLESENGCFRKNLLFVFLSYFQVNRIILTFHKNFTFTFNFKKLSTFSLYFWHKLFGSLNKEIFLHVLLNFLFAIISKLSENVYQQKWNNFFVYNKYF